MDESASPGTGGIPAHTFDVRCTEDEIHVAFAPAMVGEPLRYVRGEVDDFASNAVFAEVTWSDPVVVSDAPGFWWRTPTVGLDRWDPVVTTNPSTQYAAVDCCGQGSASLYAPDESDDAWALIDGALKDGDRVWDISPALLEDGSSYFVLCGEDATAEPVVECYGTTWADGSPGVLELLTGTLAPGPVSVTAFGSEVLVAAEGPEGQLVLARREVSGEQPRWIFQETGLELPAAPLLSVTDPDFGHVAVYALSRDRKSILAYRGLRRDDGYVWSGPGVCYETARPMLGLTTPPSSEGSVVHFAFEDGQLWSTPCR